MMLNSATIFQIAKFVGLSLVVVATIICWIDIRVRALSLIEVDDDGNQRWDGPEASQYRVISFASSYLQWALVVILFGASLLSRKMSSTTMKLSILGGSLAMYANLALLCCFYFLPLNGSDEEEDDQQRSLYWWNNNDDNNYNNNNYNNNNNNNGNNNNGNYDEEEEEERLQKLISVTSLVVALVYGILSALFFAFMRKSATTTTVPANELPATTSTTIILRDIWEFVSLFAIATVAISFFIGLISLVTDNNNDEDDRGREEEEGANIYNFLLISANLLLVSGLLCFGGIRSFFGTNEKTFGFGFLSGLVLFAALPLLFVTILYGGFFQQEDDRRDREEGNPYLGPTAMSFVAFASCAIAMMYVLFGALLVKHHPLFEEEQVTEDKDENDDNYVAMDEEEKAVTSSAPAAEIEMNDRKSNGNPGTLV